MADGDSMDLFRSLLQQGPQDVIDTELTATIGAELHEPTEARTNQTRRVSRPAGDIELRTLELAGAPSAS